MTTPSGSEPKPAEHHLEVSRTARYWTLGDPQSAEEVWFVLHGYRQLARRFLRRFGAIAGPERLIVAPEGLSRFYVNPEPGRHGAESVVGASWMTREDRLNEIRDYVGYLDRVAAALSRPAARRTVLGFSQGAATAARWLSMGEATAERLVLWAGFLPHDQDLARASEVFSRTELVLIRGEEDPALTEERLTEERQLLATAGIEYRIVRYAGGHDIHTETLKALG